MKGWGMKGASKGKNKGPSGPQLERERLTAEKFMGKVSAMKGKYGFIEPAEPVDHPNAQKKNGSLWFSVTDVISGRELTVGEDVSFHIYNDSTGSLGAEEIEDFGEPAGGAAGLMKPAVKPAAAASPYGKAAGKGKAAYEAMDPWGMGKGWGKNPWAMEAWAMDSWYAMEAMGKGAKGKGAFEGWGKGGYDAGKGKGKGKAKQASGPSGPSLERERLTADKFSGELVEWKGKFGYIQPAEPIEHEAAKRKAGKVWVSISDCPGGAEMAVGTICQFHVYVDGSGILGAEEVE